MTSETSETTGSPTLAPGSGAAARGAAPRSAHACGSRLYELVSDPDPARARAVTEAMCGMHKIVVADLEAAADAAPATL